MVGFSFSLFYSIPNLYKARKIRAKTTIFLTTNLFLAGLVSLSSVIDFITIALTNNNMDNALNQHGLLRWVWVGIFVPLCVYSATDVILPNKKKSLLFFMIGLSIIYELCLFLDPMNSIIVNNPDTSSEEGFISAISPNALILFITFSIMAFIAVSTYGIGFFYKAMKSEGIIRKKFICLSLGNLIYAVFGTAYIFIDSGLGLMTTNLGFLISFFFSYIGIREEPEREKKDIVKKEIKIKDSIFMISKRPEQISEEEISISKEKKICLVCKGKAVGITYICTNCEAYYCSNCAQALSSLENQCWACDTPIDSSKPVNTQEKEELAVEIETEKGKTSKDSKEKKK